MSTSDSPFLRPTMLRDPKQPDEEVVKIGIVPFVVDPPLGSEAGEKSFLKVLVMKPTATKPHLGAPPYQLAKGTRMLTENGKWRDMREEDLHTASPETFEKLAETAKREGAEEVGLKESNVRKVYDLGVFHMTSASDGKAKALHMFAAEVKDPKDFGKTDDTTAETKWMRGSEFAKEGRDDHSAILQTMLGRLERAVSLGVGADRVRV